MANHIGEQGGPNPLCGSGWVDTSASYEAQYWAASCTECVLAYEKEHGAPSEFDSVGKPQHYNSHPSGVECIEITKHMNYCLGNVIKYVWRAGLKGEAIEDLEKAATYLQYEIERLKSL